MGVLPSESLMINAVPHAPVQLKTIRWRGRWVRKASCGWIMPEEDAYTILRLIEERVKSSGFGSSVKICSSACGL